MKSQHTTYTSCPHMLGHATQSHHLVPDCLGTEGIGEHECHVHRNHPHMDVKPILPNCMFV